MVDHFSGFDTASDTYDGGHPNAAGDQKMADRWFSALTAVLDGTPPTDPPAPPTSEPPPPSEDSTTPGSGCSAADGA